MCVNLHLGVSTYKVSSMCVNLLQRKQRSPEDVMLVLPL